MSGSATTVGYTGASTTWTAPAIGNYDIAAFRAQGGSVSLVGDNGAEIGGEFSLTAGEVLTVAVGGVGGNAGCGGGGFLSGGSSTSIGGADGGYPGLVGGAAATADPTDAVVGGFGSSGRNGGGAGQLREGDGQRRQCYARHSILGRRGGHGYRHADRFGQPRAGRTGQPSLAANRLM